MVTPTYLGIDQSVGGFGLSLVTPSLGLNTTRSQSFPLSKYGGREVLQLMAVEDWLIGQLGTHHERIKRVAREGFAYGAINGREKAGALAYAVDSTLLDWVPGGCYPDVVQPSNVKVFATGKGTASKQEMLDAVKTIWSTDFGKDDNKADAYVLAQIAYALDGGNTGSPYQDKFFDELAKARAKKEKKRSRKKS